MMETMIPSQVGMRLRTKLALSNAINNSSCSVICPQESKIQTFNANNLKAICTRRFDSFAFIPSMGASGGIVTIWCSSLLFWSGFSY